MQNPPAYVQVDAAGRSSRPNFQYPSLYSGVSSSSRDPDSSGMNNLFTPVHLGHHSVSSSDMNASRAHHLHNRLTGSFVGKSTSGINGMGIVPGLPSFPQQRSFDGSAAGGVHHHHHHSTANLNDAFVNSFGLTSGTFFNPYAAFADRARTPSPLHRLLHNQLMGAHGTRGGPDSSHFIHDDLLLDTGPFRGLNLSTNNFAVEERHHTDPLISSGHLSRSLDDLSVVLDNSNDSVDLPLHRNSSSPDDSLSNDLTQSENISTTTEPVYSRSKPSTTKHRRVNGRSDISRTCPTCGKTFGNSSGLAKHRLTHSDERKYLCNICMKSFKRQDHLSGHLLTHSDKKPFECPVESCGKSYCDSRSLKRHLDQHEAWMVPDSVRLMYSDNTVAEDLDDTQSVLDGQETNQSYGASDALKPFACQICRRRFKNGPALNGHMRLHGGYFTKKTGEYSSGSPSLLNMKLHENGIGSSQNSNDYSPPEHEQSPLPSQMSSGWNSSPEEPQMMLSSEHQGSVAGNPLNHVAVIRHVPPSDPVVSLRSALPPVSTLASPSNSPTTLNAPFSFYPTPPPLAAPASAPIMAPAAVSGKHRRHSDSDSAVPPKRLCTVTDMLRHTINLNMARKLKIEHETAESDSSQRSSSALDLPMEVPEIFDEEDEYLSPVGYEQDPVAEPSLDGSVCGSDDVMEASPTSGPLDNSPAFSDMSAHSSTPEANGNPSITIENVSGSKMRRKHRPEPLFIPPHVDATQAGLLSPGAGFPSRLRSPRMIPPGEKNGCSPPPYTPPPMLSPNRSGSGLFWNVMSSGTSTPQSGSRILLRRSLSNSSSGQGESHTLLHRPLLSGTFHDDGPSPFSFVQPPETDLTPHINVGPCHQAELPPFNPRIEEAEQDYVPEQFVWLPHIAMNLTDEDIQNYIAVGDSAVVPKGGRNTELAHHLLFLANGDILLALKMLIQGDHSLNAFQRLLDYHYQNCSLWSPEEISAFSAALLKHDKDFFLVSNEIKTKTVKECVEFYYSWKKMLPDEYKRIRGARRKRLELVTRSRAAQNEKETSTKNPEPPKVAEPVKPVEPSASFMCQYPSCGNAFGTKQALSAHSRVHLSRGNRVAATLDMCPPPQPKRSLPGATASNVAKHPDNSTNSQLPFRGSVEGEVTDFPCRLCGKVFQGVKSRNAHMKVHRLTESQPPLMTNPHHVV